MLYHQRLMFLLLWLGIRLILSCASPAFAESTPHAEPFQHTVQARIAEVTQTRQAVGTIRPKTETRIEAQLTARILEIRVHTGTRVKKGDVLVVLDTQDLTSRQKQATQALASAEAATQQARQAKAAAQAAFIRLEGQYKRIRMLFNTDAVAQNELDQAQAAYAQAEANMRRASEGVAGALAMQEKTRNMLEEAGIALEHGSIRALEDGEVVRREAEPGDLAFPGKTLLVMQTNGVFHLEAYVREGLIRHIRPGMSLAVVINALDSATLEGVVEKVVPAADPLSRTFEIHVALPPMTESQAASHPALHTGLYPGMFGRALIPVGTRSTVLIPAQAVSRTGQLETVRLRRDDATITVYVKTGAQYGNDIEVLSGLHGGESLILESVDVQ